MERVINIPLADYINTANAFPTNYPYGGNLNLMEMSGPTLTGAFAIGMSFLKQIKINRIVPYGFVGINSPSIGDWACPIESMDIRVQSQSFITNYPDSFFLAQPPAADDAVLRTYDYDKVLSVAVGQENSIKVVTRELVLATPLIIKLAVTPVTGSVYSNDPEVCNYGFEIYYEEL